MFTLSLLASLSSVWGASSYIYFHVFLPPSLPPSLPPPFLPPSSLPPLSRVEVGVEDDLSPESGSDAMEVDDHPNEASHRSTATNITGALLPDTMAKFHV